MQRTSGRRSQTAPGGASPTGCGQPASAACRQLRCPVAGTAAGAAVPLADYPLPLSLGAAAADAGSSFVLSQVQHNFAGAAPALRARQGGGHGAQGERRLHRQPQLSAAHEGGYLLQHGLLRAQLRLVNCAPRGGKFGVVQTTSTRIGSTSPEQRGATHPQRRRVVLHPSGEPKAASHQVSENERPRRQRQRLAAHAAVRDQHAAGRQQPGHCRAQLAAHAIEPCSRHGSRGVALCEPGLRLGEGRRMGRKKGRKKGRKMGEPAPRSGGRSCRSACAVASLRSCDSPTTSAAPARRSSSAAASASSRSSRTTHTAASPRAAAMAQTERPTAELAPFCTTVSPASAAGGAPGGTALQSAPVRPVRSVGRAHRATAAQSPPEAAARCTGSRPSAPPARRRRRAPWGCEAGLHRAW